MNDLCKIGNRIVILLICKCIYLNEWMKYLCHDLSNWKIKNKIDKKFYKCKMK